MFPFLILTGKAQRWNLTVAAGAVLGGYLAANVLSKSTTVAISSSTVEQLNLLGIHDAGKAYMPTALFDTSALTNTKSLIILCLEAFWSALALAMLGAVLLGHAISGLSNVQLPSLIAVVGFFAGGLLVNHFILPYILA